MRASAYRCARARANHRTVAATQQHPTECRAQSSFDNRTPKHRIELDKISRSRKSRLYVFPQSKQSHCVAAPRRATTVMNNQVVLTERFCFLSIWIPRSVIQVPTKSLTPLSKSQSQPMHNTSIPCLAYGLGIHVERDKCGLVCCTSKKHKHSNSRRSSPTQSKFNTTTHLRSPTKVKRRHSRAKRGCTLNR